VQSLQVVILEKSLSSLSQLTGDLFGIKTVIFMNQSIWLWVIPVGMPTEPKG
jgi:hypothetical protein